MIRAVSAASPEVGVQCGEQLVEPRDLLGERRQARRHERPTVQHRARVADHAGHVPHQLVRRTDVGARAELAERGRRVAERLLRAVRERREKVLEETPRLGHRADAIECPPATVTKYSAASPMMTRRANAMRRRVLLRACQLRSSR